MTLPIISTTKQEEDESFRIIADALGNNFIIRRQTENDYGIDAEIELISDGCATGKIIKAQIKSSIDLRIRKKDNIPTVGGIKQSTLNYWINISSHAHVIVFAVDLKTRDIYITGPIYFQATRLIDFSQTTKTVEFLEDACSADKLSAMLFLFFLTPSTEEQIKKYRRLHYEIKRYIDFLGDINCYDLQCEFDWETMKDFIMLFDDFLKEERLLCVGKPPDYLLDKKTIAGKLVWTEKFWKSLLYSEYPNLFAREPFGYLILILLKKMNLYRKQFLDSKLYWLHKDHGFLLQVFQSPIFINLPNSHDEVLDFCRNTEKLFNDSKEKGTHEFYSFIQPHIKK